MPTIFNITCLYRMNKRDGRGYVQVMKEHFVYGFIFMGAYIMIIYFLGS